METNKTDQKKKIGLINRFAPFLYDIGLALICLYIALRSRTWANSVFAFETGYIIGALLIAYYILDMMLSRKFLVAKTKSLTYIVSISTFIVMYLSISVLISDIIQGIIRIFVRDAAILSRIFTVFGAVCLAVTVTAACAGLYKTSKVVTVNYSTDCDKLDKNCRIALLTDLHIGFFVGEKHIRKTVEQVNALDADIVLISGDMINSGNTHECKQIEKVEELLSHLKSRLGIYAVTGNHDPLPDDEEFRRFLDNSHIKLIDDDVVSVDGLELVGRGTRIRPRKELAELMAKADNENAVIVIDHDPMGISDAQEQNADLVLCGHTHKGQVFPLNLFVRFLYSKEQLWGFSRHGRTSAVVSAGAGFFSMPMRLGSDCEVVCVDLKTPKNK